MFKNNDKLTLTVINAKNIDGNILPLHIKLPTDINQIKLPDSLVSIDIFEYQEEDYIKGTNLFSIYIGDISTTEELLEEIENKKVKFKIIPKNTKQPVCFQTTSEIKIIYAILNHQDIVVKNLTELKILLQTISNELSNIQKHVTNIKKLSLNKNRGNKN